jgi:hypothetical protein
MAKVAASGVLSVGLLSLSPLLLLAADLWRGDLLVTTSGCTAATRGWTLLPQLLFAASVHGIRVHRDMYSALFSNSMVARKYRDQGRLSCCSL